MSVSTFKTVVILYICNFLNTSFAVMIYSPIIIFYKDYNFLCLYDIADMLYLFVLQKWLEGIADIDTGFWDKYTKAAKVNHKTNCNLCKRCSLFFCEGLCRSLFRIWLSRRCSLTFICLCLWILHFRLLCRVSLSFIGFLYDRQIPLIISQIRMGNVCRRINY
jgi:hypothetical protein